MSNSSFCTNCGAKLDSKQKFCPSCGKGVNGEEPKSAEKAAVINNVPEQKQTNGLAVAGFIVSLVSSLICCGAFNIVGLVLSIVGLVKAKDYGGSGKGMAIAGIIISVLFTIIVTIIYVIAAAAGGFENVYYSTIV